VIPNRRHASVGEDRGVHPVLLDACAAALAVLLPTECAACGAPDVAVCAGCRSSLTDLAKAHTIDGGGVSLTVWSTLDYSGVVRDVIVALKERNRTDVARALAPALSAALRAACAALPPPPPDVPTGAEAGVELLTLPVSRASARARGYDPVRLLLRCVPGAPIPARPLRLVRQPRDQAGLSAGERQANLHNAMRSRVDLTGRRFLLVDDVLTTGASLREAQRAVVGAGGAVAGAVTVAFAARRHP
jgi:ComF family protein